MKSLLAEYDKMRSNIPAMYTFLTHFNIPEVNASMSPIYGRRDFVQCIRVLKFSLVYCETSWPVFPWGLNLTGLTESFF